MGAPFSNSDVEAFHQRGYLVVRGLAPADEVRQLRQLALADLRDRVQPLELEAQVNYPGAPASIDAPGGDTVRRLLHAWQRHPSYRRWAGHPDVVARLQALFEGRALVLSQSHHNCVMTKMPVHSSETGWHRDVRYWSFSDDRLINTWLALGPESDDNGCVKIIPGSHRLDIGGDRLDEAKFLRTDHPDNRPLIDTAERVELAPGDVMFFHAGAFHAAGRNRTREPKLAVVFTYHDRDTLPLPHSKSARYAEVELAPAMLETAAP